MNLTSVKVQAGDSGGELDPHASIMYFFPDWVRERSFGITIVHDALGLFESVVRDKRERVSCESSLGATGLWFLATRASLAEEEIGTRFSRRLFSFPR